VVKYTSLPELVFLKKHNTISYHAVQEAAAAGVLEVHKDGRQIHQIYSPSFYPRIVGVSYWGRFFTLFEFVPCVKPKVSNYSVVLVPPVRAMLVGKDKPVYWILR
jgi:hypothetical protein